MSGLVTMSFTSLFNTCRLTPKNPPGSQKLIEHYCMHCYCVTLFTRPKYENIPLNAKGKFPYWSSTGCPRPVLLKTATPSDLFLERLINVPTCLLTVWLRHCRIDEVQSIKVVLGGPAAFHHASCRTAVATERMPHRRRRRSARIVNVSFTLPTAAGETDEH